MERHCPSSGDTADVPPSALVNSHSWFRYGIPVAGTVERMIRLERLSAARTLRIATRVVITLILVVGITAMHSMLDASMNMRMSSASAATATPMPPDPTAAATAGAGHRQAADSGEAGTACTDAMSHGGMHACLFVASPIVLAVSASPAVGEQHVPSPLRSAPNEQGRSGAFATDRVLALQVLRI